MGVGALILKEEIHLQPLIRGGGQEFGMRSGTLSAPLILSFTAALKAALKDQAASSQRLRGFQEMIENALPEAIIYGKDSPRVAHVVYLSMPYVPAPLQLMAFDLKGIAVGVGAACSSGAMKDSHVLSAMGIAPLDAQCAIRVSMGWQTQEQDLHRFIDEWRTIYAKQLTKEAM